MRRLFFYILFCIVPIFRLQAEVTVAAIVPQSDTYEQQGTELLSGIRKAVDEINRQGGLSGEKLNLLPIDDQCSNSIAISTAQMLSLLKDRNIRLVIGPYCANSFDEIADIYAKAQIFQIIPTAINYTQAKTIKKGLIKMLGYTNQEALDFFTYYNKTFAGKKVAVISKEDDVESMEEANAIIKEFARHGKSILVKLYTYETTKKDYDALADMIFADDNKIAFLLGTAKNIRKMARSIKEQDEDFVLFTNKYSATKDYFDYLGRHADGTYFMELRGRDDDPDFAEILVKLRLSGFEAEGLSIYGYSAVKLWEQLVKKAKSFDYNKISSFANDKNIKTEFGNKMFHNGAPRLNEPYAIFIYQDENYEKVY